ncbi:ATP-binding protein [Ideonella oryzae]|uniref:ATP-binding protein n=1 Tax=Ideonella oryzae TaxID=2937441 RepID=A0ABT1BU49_9BURK|nr:ATP-binding protein [Ideonella oryzae]MCO5979334.1 ATP-binding protein [Ideonella oryzae]
MDIQTLISELSKAPTPLPEVDAEYCNAHAIHYKPKALNFYVEPALNAPNSLSPILLISAPAAVGKTTLAHHIHAQLAKFGQGALYIPLQDANIGHDFFAGRLAGVFPQLSKRQILDSVFKGEIVLLFDGYDEVTMRSDQIDRNKEFIAEIYSELTEFEQRNGKACPCIAFLFRSVFADFGVFDEIKQAASEISVLFFDATRRKQFLAEYLNSKGGPSKGHLSRDFLDGFEKSLDSAKDDASVFFGHAIVLSAFGDYLHEQNEANAAKLVSSLKNSETTETVAVELLTNIIRLILEREEGKFPVRDYSPHMPSFVPYSSHAQEKLLLGVAADEFLRRAGRKPVQVATAISDLVYALEAHAEYATLDDTVQEKLSRDYRNELEARITHHPFIDVPSFKAEAASILDKVEFRNPVYREYYFAQVVLRDPKGGWALDAARNDYSHYLALFFLGLAQGRDISQHEHFLFSLISLFATSSSGNDFYFKLQWKADDSRWEGAIDTSHLQVKPFFLSSPLLTISVPLHGILQDAIFIGEEDCMIEIAGPGPDATDGQIELADCTFAAPEIIISAYATKFSNCELSCETLSFADQVGRLEGMDTLAIRGLAGKEPRLQLSEYVENRWEAALNSAKNVGGLKGKSLFRQKLQKVLLRFRKHHRAEFGCYDKKFRTRILADNNDAEVASLSEFLFEHDFLTRSVPGLIVMDQAKFSDFDINYAKQNQISFGPKSEDLYSELISSSHGKVFK